MTVSRRRRRGVAHFIHGAVDTPFPVSFDIYIIKMYRIRKTAFDGLYAAVPENSHYYKVHRRFSGIIMAEIFFHGIRIVFVQIEMLTGVRRQEIAERYLLAQARIFSHYRQRRHVDRRRGRLRRLRYCGRRFGRCGFFRGAVVSITCPPHETRNNVNIAINNASSFFIARSPLKYF